MKVNLSIAPLKLFAILIYLCSCVPVAIVAQQKPPANPPPQQMPPEVRKAAEKFSEAVKLQQSKKLDLSISAYREFLHLAAIAKLPETTLLAAYQNMAIIYRFQGKATPLEEMLLKIIAMDKKNPTLYVELAGIYSTPRVHRYEDAKKYALKTLELKPPANIAAAAHFTLGSLAAIKKDAAGAEQEYGEAARLAPGNAQTQYNYGLALFERKKYAPALAAMKKAVAGAPRMAQGYFYIGAIQELLHKNPEAIAAYQQGLKSAPNDPTILFNLGRLQQNSGKGQEAITSYLGVLSTMPQNFAAQLNVAELYSSLHNYTAAKQHFQAANKIAPKETRALLGLALAETETAATMPTIVKRNIALKEAEVHYLQAATIDPATEIGPNSLAQFYERTNRFKEAQKIYEKRLKTNPQDINLYRKLSNVFIMQRNPAESIAVWRKYQLLKPEVPESYGSIAQTLEAEAKWDEAAAEWQKLLAQKPGPGYSAGVLVAIGKDDIQAKKLKEARGQFESVLKMDVSAASVPKEQRTAETATIQSQRLAAMRGLSEISQAENKTDEAISWLQRVKTEEAATSERTHQPIKAQTYKDIARLYEQAKKPDLAVLELEALALVTPTDSAAFEAIALLYESQNKMDEAIAALRKGLNSSKDPAAVQIRIAEDYQRASKLPEAIKEYELVLKDFPKEVRILAPLALAYRQAERDADALKTYDEILKIDARAQWVQEQRALVLTHMKRYGEARAIYENQLKQSPENRQLYASIAYVFAGEGKPDAFLDWAELRLEKNPENPVLMAVTMEEFVRQKKEEAGWSYIRALVDKNKTKRPVLEGFAAILAQHNKKQEALQIFRQIVNQNPNDLSAQVTLAEQLAAAGEKAEAYKVFANLIGRSGLKEQQRIDFRRKYALLCAQTGNNPEELVQLQAIFLADPNDFETEGQLAQRLEAANRENEALPHYLHIADVPAYPVEVRAQIRDKIGAIYLKQGKKVEAIAQYREALKLYSKDKNALEALMKLGEKLP